MRFPKNFKITWSDSDEFHSINELLVCQLVLDIGVQVENSSMLQHCCLADEIFDQDRCR